MRKKKLFGRIGLVLVALMTAFAYYLPTSDAAATSDSHTDIIRVTVYDQYPAVTITSPEDQTSGVSEDIEVTFSYENANHVDFILSYDTGEVDGEGQPIYKEISLPTFNPDDLDPTFFYASGDGTVTFKLGDYLTTHAAELGNNYGNFTLTARAVSPVGYAEDAIEFSYSPTIVTQAGSDSAQDPIVEVSYDDGVAKVELMVTDKNGNPLFDEPIVVLVTPDANGDYLAGAQSVTLPFGSYGLASGDYLVYATSYSRTSAAAEDEDGNPVYNDDGNPVYVYGYAEIANQHNPFPVTYVQPAPDVPNTGRFLGNLNIAQSDYVITALIAFSGVLFIAFLLLGRKKKNYRKNYRSRR